MRRLPVSLDANQRSRLSPKPHPRSTTGACALERDRSTKTPEKCKDALVPPPGRRARAGGCRRSRRRKGIEFFEKKIRPVLVEHCYECHSAEAEQKQEAQGRPAARQPRRPAARAATAGRRSCRASRPRACSIKALRYDGDVKMPPKGKLPDAVIADFEQWVDDGRARPATRPRGRGKPTGIDLEDGPQVLGVPAAVASPPPPAVKDAAWPRERHRPLHPGRAGSEGADARPPTPTGATLMRRLYFDLTGLPPTPEEVDAFVDDASPDAYEKLVDRLLASPHFGERWGRHWLDVARFAESLTLRGFVLKDAWRYRDYVIDALQPRHAVRPVRPRADRRRPAAGRDRGRAPPAADRHRRSWRWATPTSRSRTRSSSRMDVVDEQLDAIGKAFLGPDDRLRPLPRPQVRPDPDAGLLRPGRHPAQRQGAGARQRLASGSRCRCPSTPAEEAALEEARGGRRRAAGRGSRPRRRRPRRKAGRGEAACSPSRTLPGIVVDDAQAKKVGEWKHSTHSGTLHRRRLPPRRERRQGREDAHLPARAARRRASTRCGSPTPPGTSRADDRAGHGLQRRRREDDPRRPAEDAADRRPVRLARAVPLREERPGLRPRLQRGHDGPRHRRRGACSCPLDETPTPAATPRRRAAQGRRRRTSRRWKPS